MSQYNPEKDFTTVECWQKARDVKLYFYRTIIPLLPPDENFNLKAQIKRAAISTTANIAEGYGRFHFQEAIQFYRIARWSLYELKDHLISSKDLKFIPVNHYTEGIEYIEEAKRLLNGYIHFIQKQAMQSKKYDHHT